MRRRNSATVAFFRKKNFGEKVSGLFASYTRPTPSRRRELGYREAAAFAACVTDGIVTISTLLH